MPTPVIPSVRGHGEVFTIYPVDKRRQILRTDEEIKAMGVAFEIHVVRAIDSEMTVDDIGNSLVKHIDDAYKTVESYFKQVRACEASCEAIEREAKLRGRPPNVFALTRIYRTGCKAAQAHNELVAEIKSLTSYVNVHSKQLRFDLYFDCPERAPSHARKPERLTTEECGSAGRSELCSSQPRHREKTAVSSTPDPQKASQTKGSGSGVSVQVSTP